MVLISQLPVAPDVPESEGGAFLALSTSSGCLLDLLPAAIYVCDADGRIVQFNRRAAQLWGRQPALNDDAEKYCGSFRMYRLDGGPLPHGQCPMAEVLATGVPVRDQEVVVERPDGMRAVALVNIDPLRDGCGKLIGAVNCFVDVSQRRKTEQDQIRLTNQVESLTVALAQERDKTSVHVPAQISEQQQLEEIKQRLAAIVASSQDAIVGKTLDGIVTSWNAGAERIFGYTASEMVGRPILVLIPDERHDEETEILSQLRRGQRIEHYETVRRRKDGTMVDVSLAISPIHDGQGHVIGASKIARDITEQKLAQSRQELLSNELQHRTRNTFAVIQSVVSRSFDGKRNLSEAKVAVLNRLQSLSKTYDVLIVNDWSGASMLEIVEAETKPYGGRIEAQGPDIALSSRAAQNFAMAIHELATNASKYGALSSERGHVALRWWTGDDKGQRRFGFEWVEQGGPAVVKPRKKGFGSAVLVQVMAEHVDAQPVVEYASGGLRYSLTGPLSRIERAA